MIDRLCDYCDAAAAVEAIVWSGKSQGQACSACLRRSLASDNAACGQDGLESCDTCHGTRFYAGGSCEDCHGRGVWGEPETGDRSEALDQQDRVLDYYASQLGPGLRR